MKAKLRKLRNSIKTQIVMGMSIVIALICIAYCVIVSFSVMSNVRSSVKSELSNRSVDAAKLVEQQINTYIAEVQGIASREDIKSMNWSKQQPVLIDEAKRINFERFQICYTDKTSDHEVGDVISTTGDKANAADREFFKLAASGTPNISDVLFARIDLKMVICVSAPIYDGDKVVGVLTGVTDASKLNDLVNGINVDNDGFCFIINKAGTKMAAADYADVENAQNDIVNSNGAEATDKTEAIEADSSYDDIASVENDMIAQEQGTDTYKLNGSSYFIGYTPMLDGQWSFAMVQDKGVAEEEAISRIKSTVLVGLVFIAIGIGTSYLLGWYLCRPIKKITDATNSLATGDLSISVDTKVLKCKNEIGDIARGVVHVRDNLREIITQLKNSITDISESSESFSNIFNEINRNVGDVSTAVEGIAEGSTSQAQETSTASEKVAGIGKAIEINTENTDNLNSSVEKMNGYADKASDALENLAEISKAASDTIVAVESQTELTNQSAKKIQEAVQMITDIAAQTNLLSLNASIEAARAGDAGRGFAVVAEEIRNLSEGSNKSAEQIAAIVEELIKNSNVSVTQMKDVGHSVELQMEHLKSTEVAFNGLRDEVKNVSDVSASIHSQTKEIASLRNSVGDTIEQLAAIAEENAASTEETSASMQTLHDTMDDCTDKAKALSDMSEILNEHADKFRLF